jgi:hypothetical protein
VPFWWALQLLLWHASCNNIIQNQLKRTAKDQFTLKRSCHDPKCWRNRSFDPVAGRIDPGSDCTLCSPGPGLADYSRGPGGNSLYYGIFSILTALESARVKHCFQFGKIRFTRARGAGMDLQFDIHIKRLWEPAQQDNSAQEIVRELDITEMATLKNVRHGLMREQGETVTVPPLVGRVWHCREIP